MSSAPSRPAGRYGEPGPLRRRARLLVVVALVVLLSAWVVWVGLDRALGRVDAQVQGFDVVDDSTVLVTFSLTKGADEDVTCRVAALSSTSAHVGLREEHYGAEAGASSVQTVSVRTQQRAVTGVLEGCART